MEVRYEIWPPRPTGGQQVGAGPQGIHGVHLINGEPSGIEASCMTERSQHKNKRIVEEMIEWAVAAARF